MKKLKAITQSGKEYEVQVSKPETPGSDCRVRIKVGEGLFDTSLGHVRKGGKLIPVVQVLRHDRELRDALGIPKGSRNRVVGIRLNRDFRHVFKVLKEQALAEAKEFANSLSFDRIRFTDHSSYRYCALSTNNRTLDEIGTLYNDRAKGIYDRLKKVEGLDTDAFDRFRIGGGRDDQSSWTDYECSVMEFELAILMPLARLEKRETPPKRERIQSKWERKRKFEEAKRTNKPILLHSRSLKGDSIPIMYREKGSDKGELLTYAMPDGTTKEKFLHSQ